MKQTVVFFGEVDFFILTINIKYYFCQIICNYFKLIGFYNEMKYLWKILK